MSLSVRQAQQIVGSPYKLGHIASEWRELLEAIGTMNLDNIREEFSDTCFTTIMGINLKFNLQIPVFGGMQCFLKGLKRQEVWREIFTSQGLVFDKKYLVGGSNFEKPAKVQKALAMAREDQCS